MKLVVLIVLYKKKITDSETIQSLIKLIGCNESFKVVIWDNSPEILSNDEKKVLYCSFKNIEYKHSPENFSLAKIYNIIIKDNQKADILLLFDQDSIITEEYFQLLKVAISQYPEINLFLPLVKQNDQVVSPGDFKFIKGKYWVKERYGIIEAKNKLAIASGMAIRFSYLIGNEFSGFDERLKLYGIDSQFMLHYQKYNTCFFVISYILKHNLSFYEDEDVQMKIIRFHDFKYSSRTIVKSFSFIRLLLLNVLLFYNSICFSIKYRNIEFMKK